jgi:hypothetical protein
VGSVAARRPRADRAHAFADVVTRPAGPIDLAWLERGRRPAIRGEIPQTAQGEEGPAARGAGHRSGAARVGQAGAAFRRVDCLGAAHDRSFRNRPRAVCERRRVGADRFGGQAPGASAACAVAAAGPARFCERIAPKQPISLTICLRRRRRRRLLSMASIPDRERAALRRARAGHPSLFMQAAREPFLSREAATGTARRGK